MTWQFRSMRLSESDAIETADNEFPKQKRKTIILDFIKFILKSINAQHFIKIEN